jgi:hypothetical protein
MMVFGFLVGYLAWNFPEIVGKYIEPNPMLKILFFIGCVLALIGLPAAIEGYQSGKKDDETKR